MLHKLEISGVHASEKEDIGTYVNTKIGSLDKWMPQHAKDSAHAEVHLKHNNSGANKCICSVVVYLPHQTLMARESSSTFESAIDLANAKLKHQLQRYRDMKTNKRRMNSRLLKAY